MSGGTLLNIRRQRVKFLVSTSVKRIQINPRRSAGLSHADLSTTINFADGSPILYADYSEVTYA